MSRPRSTKNTVCSEPGCDAPAKLKGWCRKHYSQRYDALYWRRNRVEILAHRKYLRRSKQTA